jgi:hypothetical protein
VLAKRLAAFMPEPFMHLVKYNKPAHETEPLRRGYDFHGIIHCAVWKSPMRGEY